MLHGKAFLVHHPRRHEQDYVTCDLDWLAKELYKTVQCNWAVRISIINYRGDDARAINTTLSDILARMPEGIAQLFRKEDGILYFDKR